MKTTISSSLLASTFLALGCSGGAGATSGDAGPHADARGEAAIADRSPGHESSSDTGSPTLSIDPLSAVAGSAHEHEPFIAVTPSGRVAVSFLSYSSSGMIITVGYRISNDRGATWGPVALVPVPEGDNTQANASVAAGDDGTLYMSWAAEEHTESGRSNEAVYVATSAPGSTTFGTPVMVTNPKVAVAVYDQPRVSVTHAGVVNVAYDQVSADGITEWIQNARSTDGKTWSLGYAAGPGSYESYRNFARFCRPTGEGRIFLLYVDTDVAIYYGDLALALRSSDDDGATWSSPVRVTSESDELIFDPTGAIGCTTDGADVWMVYGLTPEANLGGTWGGGPVPSASTEHTMTEVRLAHSGDGGKTIDRIGDVLDTHAGSRAMYPVLTSEGQGTLDLSYYVGDSDNDPKAALRRTRSTDGTTFASTVPVHSPLTLVTDRAVPQWIGDYVGGAFQGGDVFLVYTDNATVTPHIAFYRTAAALPAGPGEPDAAVPQPEAGDAGGCYTGAKFTARTWAPPTAFGQGVCSPTQVTAYLTCTGSGDCSAFRAVVANAGCLACLETPEGAAAHGPFVTQAVDGGVSVLETNYGGCQAHFDGHTGAGCCGQQLNDSTDCWNSECETCSDYANPAEYGPTYDCYYTATEVGACTGYLETTSCAFEALDGGSATACNDPATFVSLWCGE